MVDLSEYIKKQVRNGHNLSSVKKYLISYGYDVTTVEQAAKSVKPTHHFSLLLSSHALPIAIVLLALLGTLLFLWPSSPEPEIAQPVASCVDGILNQDEVDIDCGGSCPACIVEEQPEKPIEQDLPETNGTEIIDDTSPELPSEQGLSGKDLLAHIKSYAASDPERALRDCNDLREILQADCVETIALENGVSDYCADIISDAPRDACYLEFILEGDYALCPKLSSDRVKQSCDSLSRLSSENEPTVKETYDSYARLAVEKKKAEE